MEGRSAPILFSADLAFHCGLYLFCLVADPNPGRVEGDQQVLGKVKRPELSQEVQPLLCLLTDSVYVGGPLQILGNWIPETCKYP